MDHSPCSGVERSCDVSFLVFSRRQYDELTSPFHVARPYPRIQVNVRLVEVKDLFAFRGTGNQSANSLQDLPAPAKWDAQTRSGATPTATQPKKEVADMAGA